jgi:hypothetical protein
MANIPSRSNSSPDQDMFRNDLIAIVQNHADFERAAADYDTSPVSAMPPRLLVEYADVLSKLTGIMNIQPGCARFVVQQAINNATMIINK